MELILLAVAAFFASIVTLYSGFGLSTLLMPIVAIFFPVHIAIALTAIVHLFNNVLKLALLWKHMNAEVVMRFGIAAVAAAFLGAWTLTMLSQSANLIEYEILAFRAEVSPVKLVAGCLLFIFASAELAPLVKKDISSKSLLLGGMLSGFFGGLSGHQGAFRSAFLLSAGLDKHAFVATNAVIAAMVDITRIIVYGATFASALATVNIAWMITAIVAAALGVIVGKLWLHKVTLEFIRYLVAFMLYVLAILLVLGII